MHTLPLLFAADVGTVIQVALVLLFIFGPLLFRLFGASDRQADRTPPKQRAQQSRPRPRPQQQPAASSTDEEIEDFLRRAQAQRGGGPAADVEVIQPRMRRAGAQLPVPPQVDMEILDAETASEDSLQSRISSSINTSGFDQRADRLGDRVEQADDAMEARLHATFDHDLGRLSDKKTTVVTADVTPAPEEDAARAAQAHAASAMAGRLLVRLRTPQGMRDAIVLREILERPQ
jgi:hypothetical protein